MHSCVFILLLTFQSIAFAATENDRWQLGIGDPTIFGWITVLAYLVAVVCCFRQAGVVKKLGGDNKFWLYLAVFLLLLGINKQLDLQSWFTQTMRDSAKAHGWYEQRRPVQFAFIALMGLGFVLTLISLRLFLANSWRHNKLAWFGIVLLCTFILMRAASFEHFDMLIHHPIFGLNINIILENGAILLIILGTFFNKKFVQPFAPNTISLKDYVEIAAEGNTVLCPQCSAQPLANTVDGRIFKCRSCGYRYSVRVVER